MTIADKAVLVTRANRGIWQALVDEALARGATRVYAGTRQPLAHPLLPAASPRGGQRSTARDS
jgi:NAD(P)-dependent dehydrogenase (short-subunit alcohol dehydrogenase family)